MTDATKAKIDKAVNDKAAADGLRGDVAKQQDVVRAADDQLVLAQGNALAAHNTALDSAHAAIEALTGEIEQ